VENEALLVENQVDAKDFPLPVMKRVESKFSGTWSIEEKVWNRIESGVFTVSGV
jgi:hypothetical protein